MEDSLRFWVPGGFRVRQERRALRILIWLKELEPQSNR